MFGCNVKITIWAALIAIFFLVFIFRIHSHLLPGFIMMRLCAHAYAHNKYHQHNSSHWRITLSKRKISPIKWITIWERAMYGALKVPVGCSMLILFKWMLNMANPLFAGAAATITFYVWHEMCWTYIHHRLAIAVFYSTSEYLWSDIMNLGDYPKNHTIRYPRYPTQLSFIYLVWFRRT